jgi:hypothetical protein
MNFWKYLIIGAAIFAGLSPSTAQNGQSENNIEFQPEAVGKRVV